MCGIVGTLSSAPLAPHQIEEIRRLLPLLAHRGPDGAGEYTDGHAALSMRRLSIIDLPGGGQPLYNEDRSLALVANGEIYNYLELRADLRKRGHVFRTGSDCEAILHAYEEEREECLHRFRGMFAFALWDRPRKRLLLARDRMGEKPLYVAEFPGMILFASEMKALMRHPALRFELDPAGVDLFFQYNFVPAPRTVHRHIRKLEPGHRILAQVDPWRIEDRSYWRMEDAPPIDGSPPDAVRLALDSVHRIVTRSDVPVGIALSGGLDSSAVAALCVRNGNRSLQAFSVGYPGRPDSDERAQAASLARSLDLPFHEVELSADEMVRDLPSLIYWSDEPIADIAGYAYYRVMKLAREHGVPVMLQGQGGDELFWGYPWVREAAVRTRDRRRGRSDSIRDLLSAWRAVIRQYRNRTELRHLARAWNALLRPPLPWPRRYVFYDVLPEFLAARATLPLLYRNEFTAQLRSEPPWSPFPPEIDAASPEIALTRAICRTYLLENGITQGDRLAMASSVELRLPLLDHQVVETVIGLRKRSSDVERPPKHWLKEAVRNLLPSEVLERPKRGFTPPVADWTRSAFLCHGRLLSDGWLVKLGVLAPPAARLLSEGPVTSGFRSSLCFKALILELWCRRHAPA